MRPLSFMVNLDADIAERLNDLHVPRTEKIEDSLDLFLGHEHVLVTVDQDDMTVVAICPPPTPWQEVLGYLYTQIHQNREEWKKHPPV